MRGCFFLVGGAGEMMPGKEGSSLSLLICRDNEAKWQNVGWGWGKWW